MSRAHVGGADWLILDALKAGHQTVPTIAAYARVEPAAAREALNRLRTQDRVRRYGTKRGAFYVAVRRRRKARKSGDGR